MGIFDLVLKNLFNAPLICFLIGAGWALFRNRPFLPNQIHRFLTLYILFCIGLKGGTPLVHYFGLRPMFFGVILGSLVLWGFFQPFLSFYLLRFFTRVNLTTAAAISACFGSISVMTFIAGTSFLDAMHVKYEGLVVAMLAIMEIPAIISGILLAHVYGESRPSNLGKLFIETVFNRAILAIVAGLLVGGILSADRFLGFHQIFTISFQPFLCLFLFDMGLHVGLHRASLRSFSWSLSAFGFYMPLIGAFVGLLISYLFGLDAGTGTLIAILTASASYIAVPAAMRIVLPHAEEAIYLPLSLGVAFPFNVVIGIPLYYLVASKLLSGN